MGSGIVSTALGIVNTLATPTKEAMEAAFDQALTMPVDGEAREDVRSGTAPPIDGSARRTEVRG